MFLSTQIISSWFFSLIPSLSFDPQKISRLYPDDSLNFYIYICIKVRIKEEEWETHKKKITKINQNIAFVRRIKKKKSSSPLNEVFDIGSEKNENGQQSVRDKKNSRFHADRTRMQKWQLIEFNWYSFWAHQNYWRWIWSE